MEIRRKALGGSALVRGWIAGEPAASRFFPASPCDAASFHAQAESVAGRFDRAARLRAASLLRGKGEDAERRLARFVEEDGFMITTGQQPGLFGGPLYGLFKAMSAIALARDLEERLDRPVLPVFWVASEDHDWEEVRSARVIDPGNDLHEIALPARPELDLPPLFRIQPGPELEQAANAFLALHPDSDFSSEWKHSLRQAYRSGTTLPHAYESWMHSLLASDGLFVVQAHETELKRASLPLLLDELAGAEQREEELSQRSAEIENAGFSLQVPFLEGGTNLFLEGPTGRERLFREGEGFRLRRSGTRLSADAVREQATADPSVLSPNVLLRPVVESSILPTLAYVAGPGEAAYFPQTEPVFRGHGLTTPIVHPRFAGEVVERKISRVMEKFGVEGVELAVPFHEVAGRLTRDELPSEVQSALGAFRGTIARAASELGRAVAEIDPTLKGPVDHLRGQAFSSLDDVERKVIQSLKRENEIALSQLEKAQLHLYPGGKPQERVLNALYYLVRYGDAFLEELRSQTRETGLR